MTCENGPIDQEIPRFPILDPDFINPFYEDDPDYLRRFLSVSEEDGGGSVMYRGSDALRKLVKNRQVGVGAFIRMTHSSYNHVWHALTPFGLVNVRDAEAPIATYEEVLDEQEDGHLIPWTFHGYDIISNTRLNEFWESPRREK
ncbi:MAG TPA: hypothetical protein VG965_00580 [Patescibacteria group bacterium]|nr:hypothetical protein [Patescibacteria group bacterium]